MPAVNVGVVAWITRGWGMGVRLIEGVGNEHFDAPRDGFLGLGDLRMVTLTSQWRWFARGTEVNVALGLGGQGYRYHYMRAGQRVDSRSGSAIIPIDLLVGRQLTGRLHVKGGFTSRSRRRRTPVSAGGWCSRGSSSGYQRALNALYGRCS